MSTEERLFDQLSPLRNSKTLIVTIGNVLKGDDAVGPLLCQKLAGKISAEIIDAGTVPENYIQFIIKKAPENLLIIDAVDFMGSAGEIRMFEPDQLSSFIMSTHSLSPRVFVDMIMQEIDVQVYFLGIQPVQIQMGEPLSAEVDKASRQVETMLTEIFISGKQK
ncbi:MAG: hydrogenase 3 maturation endopeptidase HyCI [Sedimentisphaerales bacterium]|nr:hydrogenase 3 maturation endopeptidase HyCI [Sedimentisphaerales bacterium]